MQYKSIDYDVMERLDGDVMVVINGQNQAHSEATAQLLGEDILILYKSGHGVILSHPPVSLVSRLLTIGEIFISEITAADDFDDINLYSVLASQSEERHH